MPRPFEERGLKQPHPWGSEYGWEPYAGSSERYVGARYERPPRWYPSASDRYRWYGFPAWERSFRGRRAPFAWLGDSIAGAAEWLAARLRGGGERVSEALLGSGEAFAGALQVGGARLATEVRERGEHVGEQLRRTARGPRGYRRSDDRVLEDVCERIAASPMDASDVEIQVNDGIVTVTGRVSSKAERRFVEDVADEVFGVTQVRNALRVARVPEEAEMGPTRFGARPSRSFRCEDLMKRQPISFQQSDSIQTVANRMRASNVGFAPICDAEGMPVGTVTDRDLAIRALADGKSPETPVSEVMSREVISCAPWDDLREAERKMRDHHKSRIVVCDGSNRLVGVISLSDILEREESGVAAETAREIAQREAHS